MTYIYFFFYTSLLVSVILMLLSINPINAVFFLISVFFSASFIFVLLNVDFLGLLFLMVYVGAIAVLFLFIVMMLNIKRIENDQTTYLLLGTIIAILLSMQLIYMIVYRSTYYLPTNIILETNNFFFNDYNYTDSIQKKYLIKRLGILIFINYPVLLFASGSLLLISMLGSIFLTNFKKGYSMRRQYNQLSRNNIISYVKIY